MKKVLTIAFTLIILINLYSCASKTADVEKINWPEVTKLNLKVPSDSKLYSRGMKSGFFLITPHSNSLRNYHLYYDTYRSLVENVFPDNIPITYNKRVEHYINLFSHKQRKNFEKWLLRSQTIFPKLEKLLKEQGLPTDFAYLPLIESGYNPNARSRMNAVGLWQFIRSTGKIYGLRIDPYVDERRDLHKSTLAAANYLMDLKEEFGSWELSMAGYNCGNLRVRRTMNTTNSDDYWYLASILPRETRNYVPKYIAAMLISKNPERYGFPKYDYIEEEIVKVSVPPEKKLSEIAEVVDIEPKELKSLNPSLIAGITPPKEHFQINIPSSHKEIFESKTTEIASLKSYKKKFTTTITYRVRSGDSLSVIARRFGSSVSSIKRANNLKSSFIRTGQRLRIPKRSVTYYSKSETKKSSKKTSSKSSYYVVKSGDTLGEVAEKFGVGLSSLKNYNGINGSTIKAGQKLSIPPGSKGSTNYRIRSGDTLSEIALKYRVSVADLKKWNNLNSSKLVTGEKIKIYH